MTEDEAKTKWCPFARVGYTGGDQSSATPNRLTEGGIDCLNGANLCLASGCMAWHANSTDEFKRNAEYEFARTGRRLVPTGSDVNGHCGLAGKPE